MQPDGGVKHRTKPRNEWERITRRVRRVGGGTPTRRLFYSWPSTKKQVKNLWNSLTYPLYSLVPLKKRHTVPLPPIPAPYHRLMRKRDTHTRATWYRYFFTYRLQYRKNLPISSLYHRADNRYPLPKSDTERFLLLGREQVALLLLTPPLLRGMLQKGAHNTVIHRRPANPLVWLFCPAWLAGSAREMSRGSP